MPVEVLLSLLKRSQRIVVLTGAGVSTASGIPDFRGPRGIWQRRQPVYFQQFLASEEKRVEYWDYKCEGYEQFRDAQPNAAHRAIVELEKMHRLHALITQNIDGLHQRAGMQDSRVLEMHGTNRWVECLSCGLRSEPGPAVSAFRKNQRTPRCECGGFLKFATISFGQSLRPEVLAQAIAAVEGADLLLALGSTLAVYPAAQLPVIAVQRGIVLAIVNQGPTEQDELATVKIDGDVSEILPPLVSSLISNPQLTSRP